VLVYEGDFYRTQGRLVSIVKLEGMFVSFRETSGEMSVFFPYVFTCIFCQHSDSFKLFQIYNWMDIGVF